MNIVRGQKCFVVIRYLCRDSVVGRHIRDNYWEHRDLKMGNWIQIISFSRHFYLVNLTATKSFIIL